MVLQQNPRIERMSARRPSLRHYFNLPVRRTRRAGFQAGAQLGDGGSPLMRWERYAQYHTMGLQQNPRIEQMSARRPSLRHYFNLPVRRTRRAGFQAEAQLGDGGSLLMRYRGPSALGCPWIAGFESPRAAIVRRQLTRHRRCPERR